MDMVSDNSDKTQNVDTDSTDELYKENAFSGWQKNSRMGLFGDILGSPFVWAGTALLILVLIIIVFWPKSDDNVLHARLDHMAERLDMLENRIFLIETNSQNLSMQPTHEINTGPLQNRMEQLEAFLHHKTSQFSNELEKINKRLSSAESKPASPRVVPRTPPAKKIDTAKYHEVQKGETLYRIGINYGISVDRLLELNNMSKDAVIRPGQKIIVSP
jgi:LysM repeat protein